MITVNAMGDACPIPVVKTKKAIDALGGKAEEIEILVDNETAVQNLTKLAGSNNFPVQSEKLGKVSTGFLFMFRRVQRPAQPMRKHPPASRMQGAVPWSLSPLPPWAMAATNWGLP